MAEWEAHDRGPESALPKRSNAELDLDYLHYQAPNGTDFKCWLIPGAQWHGGRGHARPTGTFFDPNMPNGRGVHLPHAGPLRGDAGLHHAPVATRGNLYRQVLRHL